MISSETSRHNLAHVLVRDNATQQNAHNCWGLAPRRVTRPRVDAACRRARR
jgi:hypothetical protein